MDKLIGYDYFVHSYLELKGHCDFNAEAYRIVKAISKMSSEQLAQLNLPGENEHG